MLDTACSRHVELMDAFRLGKTATPGKCLPVLVKLHSACDQRALVSRDVPDCKFYYLA